MHSNPSSQTIPLSIIPRRGFLAACSGLLLTACAPCKQLMRTSKNQEIIRTACVGDSITYGAGIEKGEMNSYPAVLGRLLGPKFDTRNFGVNGATLLKNGDMPFCNQPEFKAVTEFAPHIVILKLGTNDSKPQNWRFKHEFADDLGAMLDHFANLRNRPKIWVCLPVPVYETVAGINEATVEDEILPLIRHVAKERHLSIIDLHTTLARRPEYFPDHVHPNAAGAALIARTIYAALNSND